MTRRRLLGVLLLAAAMAGPAAAAGVEDAIVAELRAEGYRNIEVGRTLLGRIRITAETDTHRREIVLDRGTGEVLRDLTEERDPAPAPGADPDA